MRKIIIPIIKAYQYIGPYLGIRMCCLFEESCSHYAIGVIRKKGFIKGSGWTILRLLACQNLIKVPWHHLVADSEDEKITSSNADSV